MELDQYSTADSSITMAFDFSNSCFVFYLTDIFYLKFGYKVVFSIKSAREKKIQARWKQLMLIVTLLVIFISYGLLMCPPKVQLFGKSLMMIYL